MAYTVPKTWARGETPTHTELNADLIDSPLALRSLNDASAKVQRTSDQSIPDNARTAVTWSTTFWNVGSVWAGGNPTRLTAPVDGVYLLSVRARWTANNSGRRGIGYEINGVDPDHDLQFNAAQSGNTVQNGADLVLLEAGDYVEVKVYQSSGGALNLQGGNGQVDSTASLTLIATETTGPLWTPPRTWANGDIGTPWRLNTHWRDNLLNLRYLRGQAVKVSLSENLSVSAGERSPIPWDVPQLQVGSVWESGSQFRAPVAGWYLLLATIEWRNEVVVSGSIRGVGFRIGGKSPDFDLQMQSGQAAGVATCGKALVRLEQDEYLEVYAYHDSDQSLTISGGTDRTRASLHLAAA